jgi:hypothetical protein
VLSQQENLADDDLAPPPAPAALSEIAATVYDYSAVTGSVKTQLLVLQLKPFRMRSQLDLIAGHQNRLRACAGQAFLVTLGDGVTELDLRGMNFISATRIKKYPARAGH